jgi:hypothetical protein
MCPKRKLLMITGTGTSISFGFPSTSDITDLIDKALRNDSRISQPEISFYDDIIASLKNYLKRPGFITFEDIYQSIQNVSTSQGIPNNPAAFDHFRPRIGATHTLKDDLLSYSTLSGQMIQKVYLDNILDTFLHSLSSVSEIHQLEHALKYLEEKYVVWSFTLNYDNFIDSVWYNFPSGFIPGNAPRVFNPNLLLSCLNLLSPLHSHLHGSLRWGFPQNPPADPFDLHEFDNPRDGVLYSKSRPSGRPTQQGETIPPSPIITGLDKTELVFRQPFFTNFLTLFGSINICTDILIAGYSFSDHHVNMAIEQCRRYRPDVRTYIVQKNDDDNPESIFHELLPNIHETILPGKISSYEELPAFPGWQKIPGLSSKRINTGPVFLWLNGFDNFCNSVVDYGLPE